MDTFTEPPAGSSARARGLVVISDVHLGSDIGDSPSRPPARSRRVDVDLTKLIDHYREAGVDDKPCDLVINGDFIDFIGMSISAPSPLLSTEPNPEERSHGLGTAEDHACIKLERVAERHRAVFASLGAFVQTGHRLVIVRGNHDREFHWDAVQCNFRRLVLEAARSGEPVDDEVAFQDRIRFSAWTTSSPPTLRSTPGDSPRDSATSRFVVHPTLGIRDCDHDRMGVVDYVALAMRLGLKGGVGLFVCYVRAIVELFRLRRASLGEAARVLCAENELRIAHLAEALRIDLQRLRSLIALQARPVTRSVRGIMASLLLDELALALVSVGAMAVLVVGFRSHALWAFGFVALAWWLVHRYLRHTRHVDPQGELVARAAPLAKLFPAAFVVMGHTHVPVRAIVDDGATYVNTGSWTEDEGAGADVSITRRAARTHLVIRVRDTGPEAELLAWSASGPTRFASG